MSKMLEATCVGGVVTADNVPVAADILSEGVSQSEGILILDGDTAKYLAKTSPDLKTLIETMVTILNQTITILTGLDAVTVSPGGQTAPIALLTTMSTQLNASKELLK